jgi:glycosyltransferase involved in cell wall biosynthesis
MSDKIKLLFLGITMNCAGTEKAFLGLANNLDYDRFDVTLLLAKAGGPLYDQLPKQIKVIEMPEYGEMFTLTGATAKKAIWNCYVKRNPLVLAGIFPYAVKSALFKKKRAFTAMRLWVRLMRKMPPVPGEYDVAAAFWGDKTMFYMVDKVKARKKIAWLHFDYSNPPRDDKLYLPYFEKCDKIINVSKAVDDALKARLPQIADRCEVLENINDPKLIWDMALRGESFPDGWFTGKRILTIARICDQKGVDFIPPVLNRLTENGLPLRWYIVGDGDEADVNRLKMQALTCEVADKLFLLGTKTNPYGYMRDCDIFVLPSRYEGKPITVEEAKIMYKPILVSRYLSADEQLEGGRLGMITDIGEEGLYSGLKKLLGDPGLCDIYTERLSKLPRGNMDAVKRFEEICAE